MLQGAQVDELFASILFPLFEMRLLAVFVHVGAGFECFGAVGASVETLIGVTGHVLLECEELFVGVL